MNSCDHNVLPLLCMPPFSFLLLFCCLNTKSVRFAADLSRRDAALAGDHSEDKASAASKVTLFLLLFHNCITLFLAVISPLVFSLVSKRCLTCAFQARDRKGAISDPVAAVETKRVRFHCHVFDYCLP